MDIKSLRYFIATAQFGSITKAAAHLHVAQPAVSRQLRKLEDELGAKLLTRTVQGVVLTGPGEHLLARAEPLLQMLSQTRAEVRNWDAEPSGPVAVALMPSVGSLVGPELIRRVRAELPQVELSLTEGLSAFIREGVLAGRVDLGLYHADDESPALSVAHLLDEPMFLIGPGSDGDDANPVGIRKLCSFPLLLPGPENPLRRMIDRVMVEQGGALGIREPVDSTHVIKRLVGAGLGYTIQCYSFVHDEVQRGELSVRPLKVPGLSRNWSLVELAGRPEVGAVSAVAGIIAGIAAELAETHRWHPANM